MHLFIGQVQEKMVLLPPNESHHLHNVLRLKTGDKVRFINGQGLNGTGKIVRSHKADSVLEIIALENNPKLPFSTTIAMAPTKQNDRTEWFLEKATEIGLSSFIPITTYHSERRSFKIERADRIVTAAVKQSLKTFVPQISELRKFSETIKEFKNFKGQKFIAHCDESINRIAIDKVIEPKNDYLFLIGPEGDFSKEEIDEAVSNDFISISLGSQRLRTETAALYAVFVASLVNN